MHKNPKGYGYSFVRFNYLSYWPEKEPSHRDNSFEYQQELGDKNDFFKPLWVQVSWGLAVNKPHFAAY